MLRYIITFLLGSTLLLAQDTKTAMDFELVWGGYYVSKSSDADEYSVMRILDLNADAYQAALFRETFTEPPSFEAISQLRPFVGHAPIALSGLLNKTDLQLIGRRALKESDLEGYRYYLGAMGVEQVEIDALMARIIGFSKEPPMTLRLKSVDGQISLEVLEK